MALATRNCAEDDKRLRARRHRDWQKSVRWIMRQVHLACKEAQERPPLLGQVIADRAAQHWMTSLERIEHRMLRDFSFHLEEHVAIDAGKSP